MPKERVPEERARQERNHQLKTPPELTAFEAELAALRPREVAFNAETVFDRTASRTVIRKTRPRALARFAWAATGFVAGAVVVATIGLFWRPTREVQVVHVQKVYLPTSLIGPTEKGLAATDAPVSPQKIARHKSQDPVSPASRYAVLSRGDLDPDRLDEYLDRMNVLAQRMESAADQWRRCRPYYWSQTARGSAPEKEAKSWNRHRELIDSAGVGELLSL